MLFVWLPFWLTLAAALAGEFLLTRIVSGDKDSIKDKGTFMLVWRAWNIAIASNILIFFSIVLFALPPKDPDIWPVNIAGMCVGFVAVMLRVLGKRALGKFYTMAVNISADHRLITNGPYRFVRHPLYAAFALIFLAWPFTEPSWLGILLAELLGGIPVFVALLIRIKVEEAALEEKFQSEWQSYASRTKRLIPWVY